MQLIGLYFKIVRTQAKTILLYSTIFLTFFILFAIFQNSGDEPSMFQSVKGNVAIIDHDHSDLSESFSSYLTEKATLVSVGETQEEIKDALFYGFIDYAIVIPEGFETSFLKGESNLLETQGRADNVNASAIELYIDSYLNDMFVYHSTSDLSIKEMHTSVMHNLQDQLDIQMVGEVQEMDRLNFRNSYFNYFSYVIMALIISVIGATMISIFRNDVLKRNLISPMNNSSMNLQLILANILLASMLWGVFSVVSLVFTADLMFTYAGFLYLLNSYVFTMVCTVMAYLISCILIDKSNAHDTLNGIGNIVTLGSAFLCGAFVPQFRLSESILTFSRFLPSYWFIKSNNLMGFGQTNGIFDATEVWKNIGVEVLFAVAFLMVSVFIVRSKRSQETYLAQGEQEA